MNPQQQPPPYPHVQQGPSAATRWLAILLLIVAGALVYTVISYRGGGSSGDAPPLTDNGKPYTGPAVKAKTVTARGSLADDEKSITELFKNTSPAVVHITSMRRQRSAFNPRIRSAKTGTGSGFVWDERGFIVTNFHVIQHADFVKIKFKNDTVLEGKIVGTAPDKDLAVIKVNPGGAKLPTVPIGSSKDLLVGQKVFAIGNPFGFDQTLTQGIVSGLGREIRSPGKHGRGGRPIYDVIQTDADINPGNSGGPLLDSAGRLIGVTTAIYSQTGQNAGIGFAVPVDTVNRIVPQLISRGRVERPGLGITIGGDRQMAQLGLQGVLVVAVRPGSAAAQAGIEGVRSGAGQQWVLRDVIVGFNGNKIRSSSDLFRQLDRSKIGETVELTLQRDKRRRKVKVTLQRLPPSP